MHGKQYSGYVKISVAISCCNLSTLKTIWCITLLFQWVDYPDQVQRNSLNLGICIPSSCSASDLQTSLQNEFDKVFLPEHIKAVVKVNPIMCTVSGDMYPYNTAYYVTK